MALINVFKESYYDTEANAVIHHKNVSLLKFIKLLDSIFLTQNNRVIEEYANVEDSRTTTIGFKTNKENET